MSVLKVWIEPKKDTIDYNTSLRYSQMVLFFRRILMEFFQDALKLVKLTKFYMSFMRGQLEVNFHLEQQLLRS